MFTIKGLAMAVPRELLRLQISSIWTKQRSGITKKATSLNAWPIAREPNWKRKVFSGIQPTGYLHLGNYLGAVQNWLKLQTANDDATYCIVDMHSITLTQQPAVLRENIFQMAATLLACGVNPDRTTIFVQSAVKEHAELCWILSCLSTMARLGHLPQYKEKTRTLKDIPLGLFLYPVLQAADIMLYKATHIPVGEDQIQHIQLTQHLAKNFNTKFGATFPICHALIDKQEGSRIRSLRDPHKKMSKSDEDQKATIYLNDEPEVIIEKVKKAMTDFKSDVTYEPEKRLGVSNLIAIHSLVTGTSVDKIVAEAANIDTGLYKRRVADAIIEHLSPIRNKISKQMTRRHELVHLLDLGADKARLVAQETMAEVKQKLGLGASHVPIISEQNEEIKSPVVVKEDLKSLGSKADKPMVPLQKLRIEKKQKTAPNYKLPIGNILKRMEIPRNTLVPKLGSSQDTKKALTKIEPTDARKETNFTLVSKEKAIVIGPKTDSKSIKNQNIIKKEIKF